MDTPECADEGGLIKSLTLPDAALFTYYVVVSLTATVFAPMLLIPLYFHYHTLRYRFDAEGLSMSYGILFRREIHLTPARMQDIHLSQDILERWLGIGTVTVQTAGGGAGGDLRIKGVRNFEAIRDYLYGQMRGVHAKPSTTSEATAPDGELALLGSIRDELKAAAHALAKRGAES